MSQLRLLHFDVSTRRISHLLHFLTPAKHAISALIYRLSTCALSCVTCDLCLSLFSARAAVFNCVPIVQSRAAEPEPEAEARAAGAGTFCPKPEPAPLEVLSGAGAEDGTVKMGWLRLHKKYRKPKIRNKHVLP